MMIAKTPPKLVAHRGYCQQYPENTLPAILAALNVGARFVEFDVQMSMDGVPFVVHDDNLSRTGQYNMSVFNLNSSQIQNQCVGEISKFGNKFSNTTVPLLSQVLSLLDTWTNATFFVEIKRASLTRFGVDFVVSNVFEHLKPFLDQTILISYNQEAIIAARKLGMLSIGWIFDPWSDSALEIAESIKPEYLLTDYSTIPDSITSLWPGPWKWVLYEISDPAVAIKYISYGVEFIETNDIGEMITSPEFKIG